MSSDIAHLKSSIKILLAQNLELANRVLELEKKVEKQSNLLSVTRSTIKKLDSAMGDELRRIRRFTNTPPSGYHGPL